MRISKININFAIDNNNKALRITVKRIYMTNKIQISGIIDEVRNGARVRKIALKDASRYASNAKGEMQFATTLFEKKYVARQNGDEVMKIGTKEVNVSEIIRILTSLKGKGDVALWVGNNVYEGELYD